MDIKDIKEQNNLVKKENKENLRVLETMYVDSKIENLDELVENRKEQLVNDIAKYQETVQKTIYTKMGEPINVVNTNPYIIQRYFFKSINPIGNREPRYNAEKLAIVWDLYNEILTEVNIQIGEFPPNLTSFCTFAGISLSTLKRWKKTSEDVDLRITIEKIYDTCFESNISLAQRGAVKEKSTIYRMKAEQEISDKEGSNQAIHIHSDGIDLSAINKRIEELTEFNRIKNAEVIKGEK